MDLSASEMLISDAHHTAASRDEAFAASPAKGNDHLSYCQPPLPGGVFSYTYLRLGGRKRQLSKAISPRERFSSGEEGITKKKMALEQSIAQPGEAPSSGHYFFLASPSKTSDAFFHVSTLWDEITEQRIIISQMR